MIALNTWLLILAFAVPMILSPGPGNTILAASGSQFGLQRTVPFWMGFEAGNLVWCLVYGFGLSEVFARNPAAYTALKWGGTAYIVYLAWCFFRSAGASERQQLQPLGFIDGFVSLSLNPKVHSMILVMFSQFLSPGLPLAAQVLQMAMAFVAVGLASHFAWIYGGQVLFSRVQSPGAIRLQSLAFGACMLVVAGAMALS